jgi:hypothetical protein
MVLITGANGLTILGPPNEANGKSQFLYCAGSPSDEQIVLVIDASEATLACSSTILLPGTFLTQQVSTSAAISAEDDFVPTYVLPPRWALRTSDSNHSISSVQVEVQNHSKDLFRKAPKLRLKQLLPLALQLSLRPSVRWSRKSCLAAAKLESS